MGGFRGETAPGPPSLSPSEGVLSVLVAPIARVPWWAPAEGAFSTTTEIINHPPTTSKTAPQTTLNHLIPRLISCLNGLDWDFDVARHSMLEHFDYPALSNERRATSSSYPALKWFLSLVARHSNPTPGNRFELPGIEVIFWTGCPALRSSAGQSNWTLGSYPAFRYERRVIKAATRRWILSAG